MKSQPVKIKLTYKLDKKGLDVPSSKTFGDLKVLKYSSPISSLVIES